MDRVKKYFLGRLRKGDLLSYRKLIEYSDSRGLGVPRRLLRTLRRQWKFLATFEKIKPKPSFIKSTHFRYGLCQMDMAFVNEPGMRPRSNDQCIGFVVCVEISSLQVGVVPVKSRTTAEWSRAVKTLKERSQIKKIKVLMTDRETTLRSIAFVKKMRAAHGIKMVFLKQRHKAYYAELFISIIKRSLGAALAYASERGDPTRRRWVDLIHLVVKNLNDRLVPGTSFKRKDVGEANFMDLLAEKTPGTGDGYSGLNTATTSSRAIRSAAWKKKIFKYAIGTRVLVEKRALQSFSLAGAFPKNALLGGRSSEVHIVVASALKKGGAFTQAPVYRLSRVGAPRPLEGWYYQSELAPVEQ